MERKLNKKSHTVFIKLAVLHNLATEAIIKQVTAQ